MKISIIVPIFKVEDTIRHCLLSIINQDYSDLELILVDDCSPDKSIQLAKSIIAQYDNFTKKTIYISHPKNRGLSAARNSGINHATGDYLFFLDSDDALASNDSMSFLSSIANKKKNINLIVGHFKRIYKNEIISMPKVELKEYTSNSNIYNAFIHANIPVIACAKLINRQFLIKNNLYFKEGIFHEDELWSFMVARKANHALISPKTVYDYTIGRPGSITFNYSDKNLRDLIFVFSSMVQIFNDEPSYYPKETVWYLEKFRNKLLKLILKFEKTSQQKEYLLLLKREKLPFISGSSKFHKQNILMRMPIKYILWYLNLKK